MVDLVEEINSIEFALWLRRSAIMARDLDGAELAGGRECCIYYILLLSIISIARK
jgi:hypothetical protein